MLLRCISTNRPAMALLEYTRADVRGGLGSALFQEVVKVARRERPVGDWLLLELDDDHEGAEELQRSNRRRIELYQQPTRWRSIQGIAAQAIETHLIDIPDDVSSPALVATNREQR